MVQNTTPPIGFSNLGFQDLLNYGVVRAIDSEFGNPPPPVPFGAATQNELQFVVGDRGNLMPTGGRTALLENVTTQQKQFLGVGALILGSLIVWKLL